MLGERNLTIPQPKSNTVSCPALVVTAPSSSSGKTTVVAAIARYFSNQGKKVRVFKTGPDFIDPNFLSFASGYPVYQLDFWMCGEQHCKQLVAKAAKEADLILIEGVMGMFDGQCSSADIAATMGIPVMAVIDAGAMAQTFGAVAYGLANYRQDVIMMGVFANRVGSFGHAEMLKASLPEPLSFCGYLPKNSQLTIPERHLGLVQAQELEDLDEKLNLAAELIGKNSQMTLPPSVVFTLDPEPPCPHSLRGVTIAVGQDRAFSFLYQANIDLLIEMGAELRYFSPIKGDHLPECDSLYLPGGYPELFIERLVKNSVLQTQIKTHVAQDKPILAECGGMLYLNNVLTNTDRLSGSMCGVLNASAKMLTSLAALGLVEGELKNNQFMRGHTFHYSKTESDEDILCTPVSQRGKELDPVWIHRKVVASYIHWYFHSNPGLIMAVFKGDM